MMPKGSIFPHIGNAIDVRVGKPINLDDIVCKCRGSNPPGAWKEITQRIQIALKDLESRSAEKIEQMDS